MNEAQLSSYIKEILKSKRIKEGTCGYGVDGEPGNKPAGPYLTSEGISPEVADKAEQIKNTMISKNRDKLFKMYGKDAEKVAQGRAINQAKKSVDEKKLTAAEKKKKEDIIMSMKDQKGGKDKLKPADYAAATATAIKVAEGDLDVGHQDDEPRMLKKDIYNMGKYAMEIYKKLDRYDDMEGEVDFPHWWQSKLTKAKSMLQSAYDYLDGEEKISQIDAIMEEDELTKSEKNKLKKVSSQLKKSVKAHDKQSKTIDGIVSETGQEIAKKNMDMYKDKNRLEEFIKEALKNPKAADLNKDGELSSYEKKRGAAIEKNLEEQENEKEYSAIKAIVADLNDKLPQFRTVDTAPEFIDLIEAIIELVTKESQDFVESSRFIQAMLQIYNKRKEYREKAQAQAPDKSKDTDDSQLKKLGLVLRDLADRGITSTSDARKAGFRLNSAQKKALADLEESKKKVDEGSLSDKIENSAAMKALEKAAKAAKVSGDSFKELMNKFNAELSSIKAMEENKNKTSLSERIFKELRK
jgi:hypothetical protein